MGLFSFFVIFLLLQFNALIYGIFKAFFVLSKTAKTKIARYCLNVALLFLFQFISQSFRVDKTAEIAYTGNS